jgi:hypothetical protein
VIVSQSSWCTHFRRIGKARPVSGEGVCGRAVEEDKGQQDDQYHRHCCGDSGGQLEACSLAPTKMRLHYHSFNGLGSRVTKQSRVHPIMRVAGSLATGARLLSGTSTRFRAARVELAALRQLYAAQWDNRYHSSPPPRAAEPPASPRQALFDSAPNGPLGNLSAYRHAFHCEGSRMGFHAGFVHSAC